MKKLVFALLISLVIISIFDTYSTVVILNAGGEEINPVMKFFIHFMGVIPALIIVKGVFISAAFFIAFKKNVPYDFYAILLLLVNAFYVFILYISNYQHLKML